MSNTTKRVLAGLVLLVVLLVILKLGVTTCAYFIILIGVLLTGEGTFNIFKEKKYSMSSWLSAVIWMGLFGYFKLYNPSLLLHKSSIFAAAIINLLGVNYLFFTPIDSHKTINLLKKIKIFWGVYFLLIISSFLYLLRFDNWIHNLMLLFIICFGTDTGAWFFGRMFGKNKLWPTVSPNKTIEGLIGGAFLSGIMSIIYYIYFIGPFSSIFIVIFPLLGALSHIGDLLQSKIKRQCDIKNSSSLIPGHGGVYDRLDSVLFLAPFYILAMIMLF